MLIQGTCNTLRPELLQGVHNFSTDELFFALYTDQSQISPNTTVYTTVGEVVASGYTAGGQQIANQSVQYQPGVAWVQWSDLSWTVPLSFVARGALIYNASKSNKAILVLDFGLNRGPNPQGVFTVNFPPYPSLDAVLRLA